MTSAGETIPQSIGNIILELTLYHSYHIRRCLSSRVVYFKASLGRKPKLSRPPACHLEEPRYFDCTSNSTSRLSAADSQDAIPAQGKVYSALTSSPPLPHSNPQTLVLVVFSLARSPYSLNSSYSCVILECHLISEWALQQQRPKARRTRPLRKQTLSQTTPQTQTRKRPHQRMTQTQFITATFRTYTCRRSYRQT